MIASFGRKFDQTFSNLGRTGTPRQRPALNQGNMFQQGISMARRRVFGREELTPVEARQGFLDRPVLLVLVASLALVCIIFGALLLGS